MTRLRSLPSPAVIAALKGGVDIATWKNEPYARLWPKAPGVPRSPPVQATANLMDPALRAYVLTRPGYRQALERSSRYSGWSSRDLWFHYWWTHPPFLSPSHFYCGHPYPPPVPDPFNHFWTLTDFWWEDIFVGPILAGTRLHWEVFPPLYTLVQYQIPGQNPIRPRLVRRRGQPRHCGYDSLTWQSSVIQGYTRVGPAPSNHFFRFKPASAVASYRAVEHGIYIAATAPASHVGWSESPIISAKWSSHQLGIANPDNPLYAFPP